MTPVFKLTLAERIIKSMNSQAVKSNYQTPTLNEQMIDL